MATDVCVRVGASRKHVVVCPRLEHVVSLRRRHSALAQRPHPEPLLRLGLRAPLLRLATLQTAPQTPALHVLGPGYIFRFPPPPFFLFFLFSCFSLSRCFPLLWFVVSTLFPARSDALRARETGSSALSNPSASINRVATDARDLFYDPAQALVRSPTDLKDAFRSGGVHVARSLHGGAVTFGQVCASLPARRARSAMSCHVLPCPAMSVADSNPRVLYRHSLVRSLAQVRHAANSRNIKCFALAVLQVF